MKIALMGFISILIFILNFDCKAQSDVLTTKYLTSHQFEIKVYYYGTFLKFNSNGTYSLSYGMEENGILDKGRYIIDNDKVTLKPTTCTVYRDGTEINDCTISMGEATCIVENNETDLEFDQFLVCYPKIKKKVGIPESDKISFPLQDKIVPEGRARVIKSLKVITCGRKKGITTDNLIIRETPSTSSNKIKFQLMPYDKELNSIPKDTEILVLARTQDKNTVLNMLNYWYYVKAGQFCYGWVFGGFVKIK